MNVYYHLPGLFEFYEFYKKFLPLFKNKTEYFYDWCKIGSVYGSPSDCIWSGGRISYADCDPKKVFALMKEYNSKKQPTFEDILDFHQRFEAIHPFQDGNGRVGRLIMFRECLRNNYVPFIITDDLKLFSYNCLRNWPHIKGYLTDTCLTAQDHF